MSWKGFGPNFSAIKGMSRSSRSQMSFKIDVVKDFTNFTEKHMSWSLLIKVQALRL